VDGLVVIGISKKDSQVTYSQFGFFSGKV